MMVGFVVGMLFSIVALFQKSAFSEVPGAIVTNEKSFWIWVATGNVSFLGFIISMYFMGEKSEDKEPKKKKA